MGAVAVVFVEVRAGRVSRRLEEASCGWGAMQGRVRYRLAAVAGAAKGTVVHGARGVGWLL